MKNSEEDVMAHGVFFIDSFVDICSDVDLSIHFFIDAFIDVHFDFALFIHEFIHL